MIYPVYTYALFAADPLLTDGTISGNWAFGIMAVVCGFFLVRTLNRFEQDLRELTRQVGGLHNGQTEMKTELKGIKERGDIDAQKIADLAVAKLLAMQDAGGRHWPFPNKPRKEEK